MKEGYRKKFESYNKEQLSGLAKTVAVEDVHVEGHKMAVQRNGCVYTVAVEGRCPSLQWVIVKGYHLQRDWLGDMWDVVVPLL